MTMASLKAGGETRHLRLQKGADLQQSQKYRFADQMNIIACLVYGTTSISSNRPWQGSTARLAFSLALRSSALSLLNSCATAVTLCLNELNDQQPPDQAVQDAESVQLCFLQKVVHALSGAADLIISIGLQLAVKLISLNIMIPGKRQAVSHMQRFGPPRQLEQQAGLKWRMYA